MDSELRVLTQQPGCRQVQMITWRILLYRVGPGHATHNVAFFFYATRGCLLGVLVFVPPPRDLTLAPSAALRISGTLLGNHPLSSSSTIPSRSPGWWPPLGRCTGEVVSPPESSPSAGFIALSFLASASDQRGAVRATVPRWSHATAEILATTVLTDRAGHQGDGRWRR